MIKVSIVVPVYNVEKYLRTCLYTLVNQTLKDIEIIIVNDGSTDNSQLIIDEFQRQYPNLIKSLIKDNGGLSDARNFGIKYCKGEYLAFLDSDDFIELDMYEKMYTMAKKYDYDLVSCNYWKQYSNNKEVVFSRNYINSKDMFIDGLAAAWNKIYKRDIIINSGVVFPQGLIYEDTEFYAKLIPHIKKCGHVNEALVHYIQRKGSIVNSNGEKIEQIFSIIDNILEYYYDKNIYKDYGEELEYFCTRILLGSSMERIINVESRNLRKKLLNNTLEYINDNFPNWKKNKYLKTKKLRNIYMRIINKNNIGIVAIILSIIFNLKVKKLY